MHSAAAPCVTCIVWVATPCWWLAHTVCELGWVLFPSFVQSPAPVPPNVGCVGGAVLCHIRGTDTES